MKYTRFERLLLFVGAVTVFASVTVQLTGPLPQYSEVGAQILLLAVLFGAVRLGAKGGMLAAIAASAVYVTLRTELFSSTDLGYGDTVVMASRLIAFGMVGVVGGEVCSRVRHGIAILEGGNALDDWSRVYNQAWAHKTLVAAKERAERYGEPFSVVLVSMSPSLFDGVSASRQRAMVRTLADYIRADVRMVDEIARFDDGRFAVVLPHTPRPGGIVVAARACDGLRTLLGARDDAVRVRVLAAPDDIAEIDGLIGQIAPAVDQEDSVAYSSLPVSTRNPAVESASSAP